MYVFTLFIHSWLRWIVLILLAWATIRAFVGLIGKKPWSGLDQKVGRFAVISIDVQLLLGLILYLFLSPVTTAAFSDFGGAMRDPVIRFWAVEHGFMMLAVVALAHIGKVKAFKWGKIGEAVKAHRLAAIFFGLCLLITLIGTPWPGSAAARPLFRFF